MTSVHGCMQWTTLYSPLAAEQTRTPIDARLPRGGGFQQPERTVGGHEGVLGGYSELTPLGLTELARRPSRLNMCVRTGVLQAVREANVSCWHVRT